jgi:hypothetical protein
MESEKFIVAEISKNWPEEDIPGMRRLLAERFEDVIAHNLARGYRLHSWRLDRFSLEPGTLNETIIAVFERTEKGAPREAPSVSEG